MQWLKLTVVILILILCRAPSGLLAVPRFDSILKDSSMLSPNVINAIIKEMSCFGNIIYLIESCSSNCYEQSRIINEIIRNENNSVSFVIEQYSVIMATDSHRRYANILFIDSYNSFR